MSYFDNTLILKKDKVNHMRKHETREKKKNDSWITMV